jgi:VCBS repeat protein/IPT/TIG domain-containing protein/FG-GAP repeat protein
MMFPSSVVIGARTVPDRCSVRPPMPTPASKIAVSILSALAVLSTCDIAVAACPDFQLGRSINVVGDLSADFDGDGRSDLVGSDAHQNRVTILHSNGDGSFTAGANLAINSPGFGIVGEWNGDGKSDLAIISAPNAVVVFLNAGNGAFAPGTIYDLGNTARRLTAADFNGDGRKDLAVTTSANVSILLNKGNGTFAPPITYPLTNDQGLIVTGDFNGDGHVDVIVDKGFEVVGPDRRLTVNIVSGKGDGSFLAPVSLTLSAGPDPRGIAADDLNGDGRTDLIVHGYLSLLVFIGQTDGTFSAPVYNDVGPAQFPPSRSVALADVNGDNKTDIVAVNIGSVDVSILLGNGDGTFRPEVRYAVDFAPVYLVIGDFDGDRRTDVLAGGTILFGKGNGSFVGAINVPSGGGSVRSIAGGDFNGDGISDLATISSAEVVMPDYFLAVALGRSDGTFLPTLTYRLLASRAVIAADFNNDGRSDVALSTISGQATVAAGVAIYLSNSDGTLATPRYIEATGARQIVAGEFNGDGKLDLALVNDLQDDVAILLGAGDGNFTHATPFEYVSGAGLKPTAVAAADVNRDGKIDLVVANSLTGNDAGSVVSIFSGNGNGTFASPVHYALGGAPASVGIADFNGDGISDLAVSKPTSYQIAILIGRGDGTFNPEMDYPGATWSTSPSAIAIADVNGDGTADVISETAIVPGNGNGTFASPVPLQGGTSPNSVVVSDLDRDGRIDVVRANTGSYPYDWGWATASVFLNRSLCAAIRSVDPSAGPSAGDQRVVITGSNLAGAAKVMFGTSAAAIMANTPTTITVNTPAHTWGAVDVSVSTAGGPATLAGGYEYVGEMTILSLSSNVGPTIGGTILTIEGAGLSGAMSVTFGGLPANIASNSSTSITVVVPAHSAGRVDVVVTCAGGTKTLAGAYLFTDGIPALSEWFLFALGCTFLGIGAMKLRH